MLNSSFVEPYIVSFSQSQLRDADGALRQSGKQLEEQGRQLEEAQRGRREAEATVQHLQPLLQQREAEIQVSVGGCVWRGGGMDVRVDTGGHGRRGRGDTDGRRGRRGVW